MNPYYIFHGNGECGSCSAAAGEYTVKPSRPHENCACEIEYVPGACEVSVSGSAGIGGPDGSYTFEIGIEVECPGGSGGQSTTVTVTVEAGAAGEGIFDALDDVVAEAAAEICGNCPPPAIV